MVGYGTVYNGNFPNNNFTQQTLYGQQFPSQQQQQNTMQIGLNGKIVDSEEMVRATEVPLGGYGIFPKADFSEIFIKTWNNNGTTNITRYAAVAPKPVEPVALLEDSQNKVLDRIKELETKIDSLIQAKTQGAPQEIYPVSMEGRKNEF